MLVDCDGVDLVVVDAWQAEFGHGLGITQPPVGPKATTEDPSCLFQASDPPSLHPQGLTPSHF